MAFAALSALACGADSSDLPDAAQGFDATVADADTDAEPSALFELGGDCGELDVELTEPSPSTFDGFIDFAREYTDDDEDFLSVGGQKILADGNAGGSSIFSELFAYEVLEACESMVLIKTENEVIYDGPSKKTDFLGEVSGVRIGVSVTRAQTFPLGEDMTVERARELLADKLSDILESSANVIAADAWQKQILAIVVYNRQHLGALEAALPMIDPGTRADTIVWLSVTDGPDAFIYE